MESFAWENVKFNVESLEFNFKLQLFYLKINFSDEAQLLNLWNRGGKA